VIHSDLAKGFIRAEVVHYDDFVRERAAIPGAKPKDWCVWKARSMS
jgi:ribosome-binding ATPase YchF (GTP1/OBG family)